MTNRLIGFASDEAEEVKRRFNLGKRVSTVRVFNELGSFTEGLILRTKLDFDVRVVKVHRLKSLDNYPFKNEIVIGPWRQAWLDRANEVDVLILEKVEWDEE